MRCQAHARHLPVNPIGFLGTLICGPMLRAVKKRTAGLLVAVVTAAIVPVGVSDPAWAKASADLTVKEHLVGVGQMIHFTGSYGDDAGTDGRSVCLYKVIGPGRYAPLAPCVALKHKDLGSPSPGESSAQYWTAERMANAMTNPTFEVEVRAGAVGTLSVVTAVARHGKVDTDAHGQIQAITAPVTVKVLAAAPPPTSAAPTSAAPTVSPTPTPSPAVSGSSAPALAQVAATAAYRGGSVLAWSVGVVVALALAFGGTLVWRRRRRFS